MKAALIVLVSVLVGGFVSSIWNAMDRDYIIVRVIDNQKCSDREYLLEMENQVVSVKGAQIEQTDTPLALEAEAFLYGVPPQQPSEEITYRVRAHYSDCAEVLSEERRVKNGWILYETIEDGSIRHVVRSR